MNKARLIKQILMSIITKSATGASKLSLKDKQGYTPSKVVGGTMSFHKWQPLDGTWSSFQHKLRRKKEIGASRCGFMWSGRMATHIGLVNKAGCGCNNSRISCQASLFTFKVRMLWKALPHFQWRHHASRCAPRALQSSFPDHFHHTGDYLELSRALQLLETASWMITSDDGLSNIYCWCALSTGPMWVAICLF